MVRRPAPAREPWIRLGVFFGANILFGAGLFSHAFLYNFYLDGLGLSESVMGNAAAALTAGGLCALLPSGVLVDRWGPRPVFLVAAGVCSAGLVAGAFATTPGTIYLAAFVAGLGTVCWRVVMGPTLMRLAAPAHRTRAFSWNVALLLASGAIWTAGSGAVPALLEGALALAPLEAIRWSLVMGAGGTALSAGLFLAIVWPDRHRVDEGDEGPKAHSGPREGALRIPAMVAVAVLLVFLWMLASGLVLPFFNLFFLREYALPVDQIGLLLGASQLLAALGVFASGAWAARTGPARTLVVWLFILPPALWLLGSVDALTAAIAVFLLVSLVPPATNPLIDQILLEKVRPERHGAVSAWRNGATEVAGLVGASGGGLLLEVGTFTTLFFAAAGAALAGAVGLGATLRRRRSPTSLGPSTSPASDHDL